MKVRATKYGFYIGERKPGAVFDMPETVMKKDAKGGAILPTWVESAEDPPPKKPAKQDAKADDLA